MKNRLRFILTILLFAFPAYSAVSQTVVTVTNADVTGNTIWTSDNEYLMDGVVYVEDGETLTIEAGTVVRGKDEPTTGDQNTALVISQGGKIFAEGTPQNPIIFTAETDIIDDPSDLTPSDRGLWGGVVILGNATINVGGGTNAIEGLPPEDPRNFYGGSDDEDDSGVFRYVSIRHGGSIFGTDNELNGLTMGALGSGTTIEFVEVFANLDDGFEWFGGTVNTKYLISAFVGDDGFDYDEGFRGKGQFWFNIHGDDDAGSGGEHDGGTDPETGQPFSIPEVYNATYIGSGADAFLTSNNLAINLRDNAGGKYFNSIFTDFSGSGISIEDLDSGEDSRSRLESGDIEFSNNIWFGFGNINGDAVDSDGIFVQQFAADAIAADQFVEDPQIRNISRQNEVGLDPRPAEGSPAFTNDRLTPPRDGFFEQVRFIGAFGYENWADGWSFLSQSGIMANTQIDKPAPSGVVTVTNSDVTGDTFWSSDNEYLMDGVVYVEDGETLTIEAGTVVRGKDEPTTGDQNTALVISQGGKIFAEGTPQNPIIFTAETDIIDDPSDLTPSDRGLWGGVVILGNATINVGGGTNAIEGLPPEDPRNFYGGSDDEDDSGVFRYVSIRHGGSIFGTDNELNGLTMGALGSGTTIEFVEVFANLDDGFEWFGGTVNTKYLISAFVGDDGFDYDEGFRGKGQFWFNIHGDDDAGSGGEHDGGTDPETGQPFSIPEVYNATYIGSGADAFLTSNNLAINLRDNAGGKYFNSIFTDFSGSGISIEDLDSGEDSRSRLESGDIEFSNNIWFGFGNINGDAVDSDGIFVQQFAADAIAADQFVEDPQIRNISRQNEVGLDPRPAEGSPAFTNDRLVQPRDGFYTFTRFIGAFGEESWYVPWAFLGTSGISVSIDDEIASERPSTISLEQNFPNPFNPSTVIRFDLPQSQQVTLKVYDITGRLVTTLVDGVRSAGTNEIRFDAANLASGVYLYRLQSNSVTLTRSLTLIK